jgi:hypothetical protein
VLEAIEDAPLSQLLTKNDGGRIDAAVERHRHRLRELAAGLHRTRSAPWPSSVAKEKAKALWNSWPKPPPPNVDSMIEHNAPLAFQTVTLSSLVRVEKPVLAFTEPTVDVFGVLCWLWSDQILKKINAALDEAAEGDKHALDQRQREEMEAQISSDMLAIERSECALIWHAEAKNEVLDFRNTTTPQARDGSARQPVTGNVTDACP